MARYRYKIVEFDNPDYPAQLKKIDNPPKKLYCAGDLSLLNGKMAAVVGSRKFTEYGREIAEMIGRELAKASIPVVSGMAYGIDTFAHEGTLGAFGKTVAVLGTGINKAYPASNRGLMDRIYQQGLIVSEFEPDFPGKRYAFPLRNRIISGISSHVIIVEAGNKSGALITANYALEQGKEIYAVPGSILSYASSGTNKLIYDGATPLINIKEVIDDIGGNYMKASDKLNSLSEKEKKIAVLIQESGGITSDEIYEKTNERMNSINAIITILELKGVVRTFGGRVYYDE